MRWFLTLMIVLLAACGGRSNAPKKSNGGDGEPCYPNGTCNEGFACDSGVCGPEDAPNNANNTNNTPLSCGNGVLQAGELCDGQDLAGQTCASQGYGAGQLALGHSGFDYLADRT